MVEISLLAVISPYSTGVSIVPEYLVFRIVPPQTVNCKVHVSKQINGLVELPMCSTEPSFEIRTVKRIW